MIAKMYDEILVQQNKLDKKVQFVEIENNDGMTPLKLAAKLGKIEVGLFSTKCLFCLDGTFFFFIISSLPSRELVLL